MSSTTELTETTPVVPEASPEGSGTATDVGVDPIAKVQDQFWLLGKTYAAAIRQCEQGGVLTEGDEPADAKQLAKVVTETLRLIELLPDDESPEQVEEEFKRLAEEERQLEQELKAAKERAEAALGKIKRMRVELAQTVLNKS